jgi:hypothetical protein
MSHRFPPPWSIEEGSACFIVRDHDKPRWRMSITRASQPALKYEAAHARRGIPDRGEHCQAAKRVAADIERHLEAAKFGRPGRWITMEIK